MGFVRHINQTVLGLSCLVLAALAGCAHIPNHAPPVARTAHIIQSDNLRDVTSKAVALADQYGSSNVLVIFDIDSTLLMMPQDLGSDDWFAWQDELLSTQPNSPLLSVKNFSELLYLQGVFYALNTMTLTQDDTPALLSSLHQKHISSVAMTARGPEYRGATLRELKNNGLTFPLYPRCAVPLCAKSGRIHSQIIADSVAGLGRDSDPNQYRDISISDGLVMLAGQDKGLFLELLLESLPKADFSYILFADDSQKNIDHLSKAAPNIDANLILYHYNKVAKDRPALQSAPARQQKIASDMRRIKQAACAAVKATWCDSSSSP